jgi:Protein of unknown function (DUF3277)
MNLNTYAFQNINAAISGGGGSFNLGYGAGNAEEGITVVGNVEEKGIGTVGADGSIMPTLRASKLGKWTIRILKTSPVNAQLQALYNQQSVNPAFWATNVLTLADSQRGDNMSLSGSWFSKQPDLVYAKDGNFNEWEFMGTHDAILGAGQSTT